MGIHISRNREGKKRKGAAFGLCLLPEWRGVARRIEFLMNVEGKKREEGKEGGGRTEKQQRHHKSCFW